MGKAARLKQQRQIKKSNFSNIFFRYRYSNIKGYADYDSVTNYLNYKLREKSSESLENLYNRSLCSPIGCYWLNKNLMNSFYQSDIPRNIKDFKITIPLGLIFFPLEEKNDFFKCILFSHDKLNVNHCEGCKERTEYLLKEYGFDAEKDGIQSTQIIRWIATEKDHTAEGTFSFIVFDNGQTIICEPSFEEGTSIDSKKSMLKLHSVLIQILLYLQIKPEEAKEILESAANPQLIGEGRNSRLTPTIIGKDYQIKRIKGDNSDNFSIEGAVKATHFRRGHYRYQPIGNRENPDHKLVWIEPVLVNG